MKKYILLASLIIYYFTSVSQIPSGYYDATQNYGADALKIILNNIIKGHLEYEYTADTIDVWDILKETDKDSGNSDNVILVYTGWSVNAAQEYNDGDGWSREHVWAKSRGDFGTFTGPGSDVHNLKPSDVSVNTARNNRWFAECFEEYFDEGIPTGSYTSSTDWVWKPRNEVKGDIARIMFYMATRYEGENGEPDLELIDYIPVDDFTNEPIHALLTDLLTWHIEDPVSPEEINRNNIIYSYQNNRNPFIDHPEWVECIWNNNCTGLWFTSVPDTILTERESYLYSISASSSEGGTLTLSSETTLPSWLTFSSISSGINNASATLSGDPEFSDIGNYPVSIKLTDGNNDIFQEFNIIVIDGNTIAFTSNPQTDIIAGDIYTYYITVSGDEGADFTLTGTDIPTWLNITDNLGESATLSGTPQTEDIGDHDVILTVTDDEKKTITQNFTINVLDPAESNQVIITQYYEGNSNDKYIEITNVGDYDIDLSSYHLGRWTTTDSPSGPYSNGSSLSGTILAGETWVYKNSGATNPSYAANSAVATTEATYFNGDDPIALLRNGNNWEDRIDCIYSTGVWGAETGFYRKATVNTGNKNISVLDGSGEWIEVSVDNVNNAQDGNIEYLGFHIGNSSAIKLYQNSSKVYPNPVNNILYIESSERIRKIEIITMTGRLVQQTKGFKNTNFNISVSSLKSGLYFLKITDQYGKGSYKKFIKE